MGILELLDSLGTEIEDSEEESFLLFSQSIPSQNLGFVDAKATVVDLTIGDRDLSIHQSPTILSSNRGGGTTGAVIWKITPLFASWITMPTNFLFKHNVLNSKSLVLELGCGISGIIGLALSPQIDTYVLTDQEYVFRLLNQNLTENQPALSSAAKGRRSASKPKRGSAPLTTVSAGSNVVVVKALDWETDVVTPSLTGSESNGSFDVVIACDCIYNDALIDPLVQTCVDACKLRSEASEGNENPTICIVAQQLRSDEVFEAWLKAFSKSFHAWRIPDEHLIDGLESNSGFVVHIGVLK